MPLVVLLFLAPVKFGTMVGSSEIGFLPLTPADWLLTSWPSYLLTVLAGVLLLLTVLIYPPPPLRTAPWWLPGAWFALWLSALAGLLRTTEYDYAQQFLWHLLGVGCLSAAVLWAGHSDRRLRAWLMAAATAGLAWSAGAGWHQVKGGGLQQTLEYVQRVMQQTGQSLPPDLLNRLHQTRAFGHFVYPNSYAAHLILVSPLALLALWRAGARVEPVRLSRWLFLATGVVTFGGALWLSASRAAVLALGAGLGLAALTHPRLARWRTPLAAAGLVGGVALFALLTVQRAGTKFSSLESRLGYYSAAVRMFASHPATGVGLGEFFPHYLRLKEVGREEAREPHSLLLGMAAQAGLPGAIGASLCLALPLLLRRIGRRTGADPDDDQLAAVQAGLAAWLLHSLLDFNLQIPGTVATAAVLPLLAMSSPPLPTVLAPPPPRWLTAVAAGLGLLAVAGAARLPGEAAYQRLYDASPSPGADLTWMREQAERAGRLLPWASHPWSLLGRVAEDQGSVAMATRAYTEACARSPHRAAFHRHLAALLLAQGDAAAARVAAALALEWYPTDPQTQALARQLGIVADPDPR